LNSICRASLVFSAAALICAAACSHDDGAAHAAAPPAPTVYVAKVVRRDLPLFSESVAALDGYVNADIRARVRGYLKQQKYKDGAPVKRDQLLFTIDQSEYLAALAAAKAAVSRARVQQQRNHIQFERSQGLYQTGLVSQQDLDNTRATVGDADSQVEAAQAELKQAELNLSYTEIHSPIDGVAGLALVRAGNLVGQDGPTLLTTVSQIDPMRVTFPLSEVEYVRHPDAFKHLELRDLAWAQKQFAKVDAGDAADAGDLGVELVLSDGSVYDKRGVIVSANRQVDASTGTISLQALFPNAEGLLRPGQYGRVRLRRMDEGRAALVVPDKALISVQGTYSVGVIGADNKAHMHKVDVGPSALGLRVIKTGVQEGDMIVVEGVQKISDGAPVRAEAAPAEAANAAPATGPARSGAGNK
jgi:membrane fusion protein (multidrug efflux system)